MPRLDDAKKNTATQRSKRNLFCCFHPTVCCTKEVGRAVGMRVSGVPFRTMCHVFRRGGE